MKDTQLKNILRSYQQITPDQEYSRKARAHILSLPSAQHEVVAVPVFAGNSPALSSALFTTFRVGAFISGGIAVLLLSFWATTQLSPFFLPGLNSKNITAEAEMINSSIDIQLSQLSYFEQASQESAQVLHDVSEKRMDHLNTPLIVKENKEIQETIATTPSPATAEDASAVAGEVNSMLNELSK